MISKRVGMVSPAALTHTVLACPFSVANWNIVYNIIMDFVFALFPWIITWKLDMRKMEKVALCATMSLGMLVAIVAAVRTGWKGAGNKRDPEYYCELLLMGACIFLILCNANRSDVAGRNAMSNIWSVHATVS
jgi:uncharacterized membrane protein